jgi:hypothetical protein
MNRTYYENHRLERNAHDKEYYRKHQTEVLLQKKEYYRKNKVKRYAKMKAWYHVPIGSKCEKCGSVRNLERHHADYGKPLEVQTLCRSCHGQLHLSLKVEA